MPPSMASNRWRVVRIRLSRIILFDSSVQRVNMEAPARLMTQSCSGIWAIQGPSWVGSPVRKAMPAALG